MANEFAVINNTSIKKGDIVEVKFKRLEDILEFYKTHSYRAHDVFSMTSLGNHLTSLTKGGFFHVHSIENEGDCSLPEIDRRSRSQRPKDYRRPDEITLIDHNADSDYFTVNEHLIESVIVRDDVGEHYFSDKFQLSLLKIDGLLVINGEPLQSEDKELIRILEKTIADISIRLMLETGDDEKKEVDF